MKMKSLCFSCEAAGGAVGPDNPPSDRRPSPPLSWLPFPRSNRRAGCSLLQPDVTRTEPPLLPPTLSLKQAGSSRSVTAALSPPSLPRFLKEGLGLLIASPLHICFCLSLMNINCVSGRRVQPGTQGGSSRLCGMFAVISGPAGLISQIKGKPFHCFTDAIGLFIKKNTFNVPKH